MDDQQSDGVGETFLLLPAFLMEGWFVGHSAQSPWAGLERAPEMHSSAENSLCIALQYQNNEITSLELRIEE